MAQSSVVNHQRSTLSTPGQLLSVSALPRCKTQGWEARFSRETLHQTKLKQGKIWQQTYFQGNFGYTDNRVENNKTATALANWNYGWYYRQPLNRKFDVWVGAVADLNGGFTYNMRNGNNPVSLRAHVSIDASIIALWNLELNHRPLLLRYQANLPLIGLMFMPHYGQSYYELFNKGSYNSNIVVTSIAIPQFRHQFSVEYPIGKNTNIRIGYFGDYRQSKPNNLKQHTYTNSILIGFTLRK